MLLGVNKFDFSKVKDDPCTSALSSKIVDIKVSACDSGQFTCDDGQCVSSDERCNQISNCRYDLIICGVLVLSSSFPFAGMNPMRTIVKC